MIAERSWELLGRVPPDDLADARAQAHRACSWLALAAHGRVLPRPDGDEGTLTWKPVLGALSTAGIEPSPGPMPGQPFRLALRLADPALLEVDEMQRVMQAVPLDGWNDDDIGAWISDRFAARDLDRLDGRPDGEPPETFHRDTGVGHAELSRWFADADLMLEALADDTDGAAPPQCPEGHLGLVDTVPGGPDGATVRAGFSAGDETIETPYFFVAAASAPATQELPPLPAGADWRTGDGVAAVLPAAAVTGHDGRDRQREAVDRLLRDATRALLAA